MVDLRGGPVPVSTLGAGESIVDRPHMHSSLWFSFGAPLHLEALRTDRGLENLAVQGEALRRSSETVPLLGKRGKLGTWYEGGMELMNSEWKVAVRRQTHLRGNGFGLITLFNSKTKRKLPKALSRGLQCQ